MTATRPTLLVLADASPADSKQTDALRAAFDVIVAENFASLRELTRQHPEALLLVHPNGIVDRPEDLDPLVILEHTGEGLGVVDADGLVWSNARLQRCDADTRRQFLDLCRDALQAFSRTTPPTGADQQPSRRYAFSTGASHYELVVTRNADGRAERGGPSVIGVLIEVTATRDLQNKLDAIDGAGSDLMKIESGTFADMNMAERLKLLEEKIVRSVKELLHFDNFEIRLIDRETNQLELVISEGIAPLRIGESMYAEPDGQGISGYVATTGESYLCRDARSDPLYHEGLDNAGSSLTVPLRLHDRVIGVFNIERDRPDAFSENDLLFAEIFGRYIALAMNILDLLVVERYTTNERVSENVLGELSQPLGEIATQAEALRNEVVGDEHARRIVERILEAASDARSRVRACTSGPRTILGAEQELHKAEIDPRLKGRRILVADDEQAIRETLRSLLTQKGCLVVACSDGQQTLDALHRSKKEHRPFDLVLSDIKMPGANGYEVFRATRKTWPDAAVILMTGFGYDPHHSIVRARDEGLYAFLFKPFKATQLIQTLVEALQPAASA